MEKNPHLFFSSDLLPNNSTAEDFQCTPVILQQMEKAPK